ncbi:MAG TPA: aldo/keto reductase [Gemmatimonadaceae bacterium]|nr:aldo/keto reductase [Gemmatimonadaceae bacterium]
MDPLPLNDGHSIPRIGLGTWPMSDREARSAVGTALSVGYRLIDTATMYGNEAGVGEGVRSSGISRSAIVVTTKLDADDQGYDKTLRAFDGSVKRLGMDVVDLYLIHWPHPERDLYVESWRAFVKLRDDGRVRSIGVSNFSPTQIERVVDATGVTPAVNQVELYPGQPQRELREYHSRYKIVTEAYSPLGQGAVLRSAVVKRLATKYNRENFGVFDFKLDPADSEALASAG